MTWNDLWNHGWFERLAEFGSVAIIFLLIGLFVGYYCLNGKDKNEQHSRRR